MRKLRLLLVSAFALMAGSGVYAQTNSEYSAALNAINDGGSYRITTMISGTKYYVTSAGKLTSSKDDGGIFTITKTSGGNFGTGFRIDNGSQRFTNPPLSNNVANLHPGSYSQSGSDRADWERQILYLNNSGKYAIRSCNVADATSSWGDAGRTHWTWEVNPVTPCYSYEAAYVWNFEELLASVNVTYEIYDGETKVSSATVVQEANSEVNIPSSLIGMAFNGGFAPYALYNYTVESGATIGKEDCTIKVNRTFATGLVHALTDLSNNKAYTIHCDRGALLTKDDAIASTSHATLHDATPGKFAIISYEDNSYIYSVADKKFVLNNGLLADMPTNGVYDAIQMAAQTDPYFLFTFKIDDNTTYGFNTNGTGEHNGCVINSWTTPDEGDQYYMVEAASFTPTEALAALQAYFHPSYFVTYIVKDAKGNTLFTSEKVPTIKGAKITTLPTEYQRSFYTYNEVNVTISQQNTTVTFTATWDGPFEISESYAKAHWYDMAVRGNWYVTSDKVDENGALKTVEANALGLAEDAYQWAFVGDGYNGFLIYNKDKGANVVYSYNGAKQNQGIPFFEAATSDSYWTIVKSTSTIENSFMLNVGGTNLCVNQYGGPGGPLKFWDSGANINDVGSAFRVFDVPTNFAEFVNEEIAPYFDATGYFSLSEQAKKSIGWKEAYRTNCSYDAYVALKEALEEFDSKDPDNFILPKTGYYRLQSARYSGYYMGLKGETLAAYSEGKSSATVVKLISDYNDNFYKISLQTRFATNPEQSTAVPMWEVSDEDAVELEAVVTNLGSAAFTSGTEYGAVHCDSKYDVVGWTVNADASQWIVEDATSVEIPLKAGPNGYTYGLYSAPFGVKLDGDATAYEVKTSGTGTNGVAKLTAIGQNIPACEPVLIVSTSGVYKITATIDDAVTANVKDNHLAAALVNTPAALTIQPEDEGEDPVDVYYAYVFSLNEDEAFFTDPEIGDVIPANSAYIEYNESTFGYTIDLTTAIENILSGNRTAQSNGIIYNLAGQRVNNAQKGIYIRDGKKMVK